MRRFQTSDPSTAAVDATGRVTALRAGKAKITAVAIDGGHSDTTIIEVARADDNEDLAEDDEIESLLRKHFDLEEEEIALLLKEAREQADHSASLQEFTRVLHERLDAGEKLRIVEMLWRVALADSHLDKHEDRSPNEGAESHAWH